MKFFLSLSCCILAFAMVVSFLPVNGEEEIYDNMIRLHVIANSDSEEDQELKLKVRDAVLGELSDKLEGDNKAGALRRIEDMLPQIENAAKSVIDGEGEVYEVKAELGEEIYPVRYYENYVLPEGKYTSLRVVIGEGEGKNWWCVLFPPMCTAVGVKENEENFIAAGFTSEQYKLIKKDSSQKYKVRFAILEILSDVLGFEY